MTGMELFGASPFDAIKRTDEQGAECWHGRDLMPVMDYANWREFAAVIEKAKASLALVQGAETAAHHLVMSPSDGGRWGNQRIEDYRLTRFGAYLVAMAGDDTKRAVAEARVYFAVRTRQAETAPAVPALPSYAEALRQLADQVETSERQARELEAARPAVEFVDRFVQADGNYKIGDVAKVLAVPGLGQNKLFALLRAEGVLIADGRSRNMPYQRHVDAGRFVVKVTTYTDSKQVEHATGTTYATPKGLDYIRGVVAALGYARSEVSA